MSWWAYSKSRLMRESEKRIGRAITDGTESQRIAAARIVNDAQTYRRWESEHERLMDGVARYGNYRRQTVALRSVAMTQIHRKALFEYLRREKPDAAERARILQSLYGPVDCINAIINEHSQFLRASSSQFCVARIGAELMRDSVFDSWLSDYESAYNDYFRSFASATLAVDPAADDARRYEGGFVTVLKRRADEMRNTILALPRVPSHSRAGHVLREPTGDTQKIRTIGGVEVKRRLR